MLIMHLFSTIQTTVYANHDRKCDIESICCTKAWSGGMNIYQKGLEIFWKPSSIYVLK